MRSLLTLILCAFFFQVTQADEFTEATRPFLQKYCISCHGKEKQKGDIVLHDIDSLDAAFKKHRLLENIIDQVEHGDMPPDDEDVLPTDDERKKFIDVSRALASETGTRRRRNR